MSPETRRSKRALPSTTEVLTVGLRRSSSVAEHPSPRKSVSDGVGRPEKRARLFPEAAQVVSRAAESASLLTDGDNEHAEVRSTSSAFVKDIAPPASVQSVRTDATITARLGKFFLDPRDRQKMGQYTLADSPPTSSHRIFAGCTFDLRKLPPDSKPEQLVSLRGGKVHRDFSRPATFIVHPDGAPLPAAIRSDGPRGGIAPAGADERQDNFRSVDVPLSWLKACHVARRRLPLSDRDWPGTTESSLIVSSGLKAQPQGGSGSQQGRKRESFSELSRKDYAMGMEMLDLMRHHDWGQGRSISNFKRAWTQVMDDRYPERAPHKSPDNFVRKYIPFFKLHCAAFSDRCREKPDNSAPDSGNSPHEGLVQPDQRSRSISGSIGASLSYETRTDRPALAANSTAGTRGHENGNVLISDESQPDGSGRSSSQTILDAGGNRVIDEVADRSIRSEDSTFEADAAEPSIVEAGHPGPSLSFMASQPVGQDRRGHPSSDKSLILPDESNGLGILASAALHGDRGSGTSRMTTDSETIYPGTRPGGRLTDSMPGVPPRLARSRPGKLGLLIGRADWEYIKEYVRPERWERAPCRRARLRRHLQGNSLPVFDDQDLMIRIRHVDSFLQSCKVDSPPLHAALDWKLYGSPLMPLIIVSAFSNALNRLPPDTTPLQKTFVFPACDPPSSSTTRAGLTYLRDCARAASVVVSIHCTNRDWCIVEVCKDTRRTRIASGSIEARSTEAISASSVHPMEDKTEVALRAIGDLEIGYRAFETFEISVPRLIPISSPPLAACLAALYLCYVSSGPGSGPDKEEWDSILACCSDDDLGRFVVACINLAE